MPGEPNPESEASPRPAIHGYFRATLVATIVSAALIIATLYVWAFSSYGDIMDPAVPAQWLLFLVFTLILFVFTLGLGFASAMLIFRPALWLLQRMDRFVSGWIMTTSFVTGFIATQIVFIIAYHSVSAIEHRPGFAEWLLFGARTGAVVGLCCLAGGIVFCQMTVWREAAADPVSNGSG